MRLFKHEHSIDLVDHVGKENGEAPSDPSDDAAASVNLDQTQPEVPAGPTGSGATERGQDDAPAESGIDTDHWVEETEKAVARAKAVGTPAAWRTRHRPPLSWRRWHKPCVSRLMRTRSRSKPPERPSWRRTTPKLPPRWTPTRCGPLNKPPRLRKRQHKERKSPRSWRPTRRQKAGQTAQAAPKAVESAQVAAQAAAKAKATADQLDEIVGRARRVNTPEAWSEALQIASAASAMWSGHPSPLDGRLEAPDQETDAGEAATD